MTEETISGWKQLAISIDQALHCAIYFGRAMADETYSARCWREYVGRPDRRWFVRRVVVIDWLARCFGDGPDHCKRSYESEMNRTQSPAEYRKGAAA